MNVFLRGFEGKLNTYLMELLLWTRNVNWGGKKPTLKFSGWRWGGIEERNSQTSTELVIVTLVRINEGGYVASWCS